MMLTGFADPEIEARKQGKQPAEDAEHVAWSVPPAAVAGLRDAQGDWDVAAPPPPAETTK